LYPALATYVLAIFPVVFAARHWLGETVAAWGLFLRSIPFALVYAANYWPSTPSSLEHLWSLSCEMQFYLLAPGIFLLGGRTAVRRHLVWGTLLLALTATGLAGAMFDKTGAYKYQFEIAVWPMMLGFCCEYRKDLFQRIPAGWFHGIIITGLVVFGAMTMLMLSGLEMKKPVVAIGTFAFAPCFLAYLGNRTLSGPIGRSMTWMGERTYSIYLWQQPFTVCNYLPNALHPVGAIVATFVGGLWFRWFERPFLSVGRKH
jgi:peptidoglycan/LPS O-acetylase OafA/YrhL